MSQKGLERTLSLLYKLYLFLNYFQPVTIVNVYTLHPGPVLINHVLESLVQRHFAISVLMRVKKSPRGVSYTGALCVVTQRSSLLLPLYVPTQRTAVEQTLYPKATMLRKKRESSYQWKYFVSISSNKKHTSEIKRGLPSKQCWAIYIADRVAHALKFDEKCSIIDPVKSFSFFNISKKDMLWKCIKKVFIRTRTRKELYISLF